MRRFIDTNILLYSISTKPDESPKRDIARVLLTTKECVLSVQVLNEFVWQVTRPRARYPIPQNSAMILTTQWSRHAVQPLDSIVFQAAWDVAQRTNYSWWDCLIVAAARTARCDVLLTEDMQNGHVIDGVRIENPFRDLG